MEPEEDQHSRVLQWLHEQPPQARLRPESELETLFPVAPAGDIFHILVTGASGMFAPLLFCVCFTESRAVVELLDTLGDPNARYRRKIRDGEYSTYYPGRIS